MGKNAAKEGAKASGQSYLGTVLLAVAFFFAGLGCFLYNNNTEVTKLVVAIILFICGLVFLIKGGDWFVDGATAIAEKFKVPEILIGATVVSIGTTLPEVMVSAQAAAKGNSGISYGNAIGSIICNVSLIAAITLAVRPARVEKKTLRIPVIFFFVAAVFYAVNAYVFGEFSRVTGIVLLLTFLVYMVINVKQALSEVKAKKEGTAGHSSNGAGEAPGKEEGGEDDDKKKEMPIWVSLVLLILGAAVIAFGATLLVDNGTIIAQKVGVPDSVIALTFVALGTSLPELVTAITSLIKGHGALSLGNIIGANLFNLVLVSGLAVTIRPFAVPSEKLIAGMNASLLVDIPLFFLVMLLLTVPPLIKGKLYRFQGITLLVIYAAYLAFQFLA
ncbi:MAG: calcium/sodium antiporter [Lachnospiraceae bacterium]|nr:calcium/sodium antiporter [Lachnospiraceae bacterium]